jgi:hypothetical protein
MKLWCKHEQNGMAIGQHKSTEWHTCKYPYHLAKHCVLGHGMK